MAANDWILTSTGRKFYPMNPQAEDLDIEDIAHALSHICRFTGHVRKFYSVAEHSCRAALVAPKELKFAMLLHDADEAYLCDVSRPVKHGPGMEAYIEAEHRLQAVIAAKWGVDFSDPRVHEIDNKMLMTERRDLMPPHPDNWDHWAKADSYEGTIIPWDPWRAKTIFLACFNTLSGRTL